MYLLTFKSFEAMTYRQTNDDMELGADTGLSAEIASRLWQWLK